ncbi:MAG: hypothetical protein QUS33_11435, partial [Dehalococcoidia bacterium]|nr:hypothetical protein [Dehalococcoidia bacterium]
MCKVTSSDSRRSLFAVLSFAMAVLIAGSMALSVALLPRAKPVLGAAQVVSIERISVPSTEGDGGSRNPSISADGRYVAFESAASNIVPNDNNGVEDIFVHDRHTGEIARVSVASDGTQGNGASFDASISADGRYVAFWSEASNLVTSDSNEVYDVFVHDRGTGETTRLSLAWDGGEADQGSFLPRISAYGRYVAFCSYASNLVVGDANDLVDIFVHDRQTGETTRVNNAWDGGEADNGSTLASISADGRYVAFESYATNLVANNENSYPDIYVHDRQTGETTRMSVSDNGTEGNDYSYGASISGDGRYVAFCSVADNLVAGDYNSAGDIFVHDRQTGQTTRVSVASDGTEANDNSEWASISADGRYVAFYSVADNLVAGDDNAAEDVFVHDRQTGETSRVSVASDSTQGDDHSYFPFVSADGRCVVFASRATNLVSGDANGFDDIFVHDRQTGETTRVSLGCNTDGQGTLLPHATSPSMSADGRYIAFESHAGNLVVSDTNETADIFVRDRLTGETTRVSVASNGAQGNHYSYNPSISADGRYVDFESMATNLVDDDGNGVSDIFVHDRQTGQTIRASLAWNGSQANQGSNNPSISANGRYVAFQSDAFNLVESDTNSSTDVFVRDLQTGQTSRVSVDSEGNQCNGHSNLRFSSISADGRYVVFDSAASNLVADDTNEVTDVFVHDRQTGQTRRVSVDSEGNQGNLASNYPTISADGRYVAFESGASNLVAGDTNGTSDIFVHDLETGETSLASLSYSGSQILGGAVDCGISADGRYVSFCSHDGNVVMGDTNGVSDIFVRDLYPGGTTIRVSLAAEGTQGNNHSMYPSVCADGKYAAFYSFASNLVPGDGNALWDAFVVSWQNPVLACAPTSIDFGARYQNFTATRTLQIQNTGTGTLSYGVSENGVWCSVNPSAGTSAGETDDVTVAIDT